MDLAQFSDMVRCRCEPAWTERKLHAPDCTEWIAEEAADLVTASEARGYQRAIDLLIKETEAAWDDDSVASNFGRALSFADAVVFLKAKIDSHPAPDAGGCVRGE